MAWGSSCARGTRPWGLSRPRWRAHGSRRSSRVSRSRIGRRIRWSTMRGTRRCSLSRRSAVCCSVRPATASARSSIARAATNRRARSFFGACRPDISCSRSSRSRFPLILGNGHAMAQNIFAATVPFGMAVALAIAKPAATLVTVLSGATGGRLTPSLATGAAMGLLLAALTESILPIVPASGALLGAAAFLAGATRAPLAAGILAIEFTGGGVDLGSGGDCRRVCVGGEREVMERYEVAVRARSARRWLWAVARRAGPGARAPDGAVSIMMPTPVPIRAPETG